jgi:hypothetical protein
MAAVAEAAAATVPIAAATDFGIGCDPRSQPTISFLEN